MGICNSKSAPPTNNSPIPLESKQHSTTAAGQAAPGAATAMSELQSGRLEAPLETKQASEAADEPKTPQHDVVNGGEAQAHKYNSAEKPGRSAMRVSESRSESGYSRKSSTGVSSVNFAVSDADAPDAEGHRQYVGANSISLKKILDIFYDKVTSDAQIGRFFDGIDLMKLKRHQLRFMALAFGGKDLVFEEDPNLNLRKVHYHLIRDKGLGLSDWEVFVGLFDETLHQLEKEVPLETRQMAMKSVLATKHYFVPIGQETEYTNTTIAALPVPDSDTPEQPLKCPFAADESATK